MRVAELVCIERPPSLVVAVLTRHPTQWIRPFLILAWQEGSAPSGPHRALHAPHPKAASHRFTLKPDLDGARRDEVTLDLVWRITNGDRLFRRLDGQVTVRPFGPVSTLSVLGLCSPDRDPPMTGAVTPVEVVVRTLLGHLRTAIQELPADSV